jgi:hypothetical protein
MSDLIEMRKDLAGHRSSLWDDVTGKYKTGDSGVAKIGGAKMRPSDIKEHVDQLDDILKKQTYDGTMNPDGSPGSAYGKALSIHSDGENIKNAANLGTQITNDSMTTEAFRNHFNDLESDAERSAIRAGATSTLTNKLGGTGNVLNKVAGSSNLMDKLGVLGINENANSLLKNSLATEYTMANTNRKLTPGNMNIDISPNAEGTDSIPGMAVNALSGKWGSVASGAKNLLTGQSTAKIPEISSHLNDITTMNPDEFESLINQRKIDQNSYGKKAKEAIGALTSYVKEGVNPSASSTIGGLSDPAQYLNKQE